MPSLNSFLRILLLFSETIDHKGSSFRLVFCVNRFVSTPRSDVDAGSAALFGVVMQAVVDHDDQSDKEIDVAFGSNLDFVGIPPRQPLFAHVDNGTATRGDCEGVGEIIAFDHVLAEITFDLEFVFQQGEAFLDGCDRFSRCVRQMIDGQERKQLFFDGEKVVIGCGFKKIHPVREGKKMAFAVERDVLVFVKHLVPVGQRKRFLF